MNILRWRRKSKKKIKFKTIVLFVFSLIMTTFAWFAYSKILNPTLNIHMASWDIQYFINNVEKYNPVGIEIPTLYPSMPEQVVKIDIINNGERLVDIDYYLQSVKILGETYTLIQEGSEIPEGTEKYLIITPTTLETTSTTDPATGDITITKTVKGAVTNDIKKLPFTIEIEHSAEIDPVSVDAGGNEVSGEGYLKVIANWIGDNHEADSEWGYRVNEYLTTTGATSAITIDLVIDSYQIEDEQEIEVTMPRTAETAPYLPTGFVRVPGTSLESGLVIKDGSGNEYVWIEVPKNTAVYTETGINLNIDSLSGTALEEAYADIETDLKAYSASYRKRDETFATTYAEMGLSETVYNNNKKALLKSIYKNGGFYIGRYETGIEDPDDIRTANSETLPTPVIKQNVYPYNYVTTPQAQGLASAMVTGTDYTTTLMYGLEWDLTLKYMEVKGGANPEDLNTDSTNIGNYYENTHFVTNRKSKISLNNGSTWVVSPYEKAEADEMLLTTGANTTFSRQNIYDLAGNLAEWTYNVVYLNGRPVGGTGGDYTQAGISVANDCGTYITTTGAKNVGFRVALFSNVDNGEIGAEGGGGEPGGGGGETPSIIEITELSLDKTEAVVTVGETLVITATINSDAEEPVIWTSSNTDVATMLSDGPNLTIGTVIPVTAGTTIITASNASGTVSQSCTVTVEANNVAGGPYMPTGFTKVSDATATSGYTIKDGSGNQYVWIEVPRNSTVYDEIGTDLDLDSLSGTALTTKLDDIEEELQEYAADYREAGYADTYKSLAAQGIADEDTYNDLKYTMLKSVYQNEGFYIGKYETGTMTARNASGAALTTAVIQANAYPYNYVTNAQAQNLATGMASGDRTSSLMFGIQWDLVLRYLEEKGVDQDLLLDDSSSWGHYNALNPIQTGSNSTYSKMGIYDLAGNIGEWTLEQCTSNANYYPCTDRGGNYYFDYDSNIPASLRSSTDPTASYDFVGFRVSLY